jgi:hypothetical protein
VSIYLNARPATVHVDGNHIKATRPIVQAMPGQIVYSHLGQAPLLPCGDRLFAATELLSDARLHLHEHRHAVDRRDGVNFSKACAVASIKNCVPEVLELGAREIFTVFSEDLPGIVCHARIAWHVARQVLATDVKATTVDGNRWGLTRGQTPNGSDNWWGRVRILGDQGDHA